MALLHKELHAHSIFQLIEEPGLLQDFNDKSSVIKNITKIQLDTLEEKAGGRIKRKLLGLKRLLEFGPTTVYLADGRIEQPISSAIAGNGTKIT